MRLHDALRALNADHEHLTGRQIDMLVLIVSLPHEKCTIRGLAAEMGIRKPAATRAARVLECFGWARRRQDPLDRRSVFIEATAAGRKAIEPLAALDAVPERGVAVAAE